MTDTIFFDVGNTLRIVVPDKAFSDAAEAELMRLVGATEPKEVFFEKLEANWKKYRKEAKRPGSTPVRWNSGTSICCRITIRNWCAAMRDA